MLFLKICLLCAFLCAAAWACTLSDDAALTPVAGQAPDPMPKAPEGMRTLIVGGGCFWCVEAIFEQVIGVQSVESGYAGGVEKNPDYKLVGSGKSRHAEVVRIVFDPKQVSADDLLRIFFTTHDPTTRDRQGNDVGPQYRSVIFYASDEDRLRAEKIIREVSEKKIWPRPIVTTIEPLKNYTPAEAYHQDYFYKFQNAPPEELAKMNAGYCQFIVEPKVRKFREKFAHLMRKDGRAP